ncbi:MAG: ACT domain-containing protein [Clostridia bacterium]|nr:ACT domain-containing protein [Clostridia bacterium]
MKLKEIKYDLSVAKVNSTDDIDTDMEFFFAGKTDEEISLVCPTDKVPEEATARDDGWKAFRIQGMLDFSLIGILSKISVFLADNEISIFAVSTFNTDYVLVKKENFEKAKRVLLSAGYEFE